MGTRRNGLNRRDFLKHSAAAAGAIAVSGCASNLNSANPTSYKRVIIQIGEKDPILASKPVKWAIEYLKQALTTRNVPFEIGSYGNNPPRDVLCMSIDVLEQPPGGYLSKNVDLSEVVQVGAMRDNKNTYFVIAGSDIRGVVYAVTETADIVANSDQPLQTLAHQRSTIEHPANPVRSVMRMFVTDVEDKAWYNDKKFWDAYLTMLVVNRFNRVNLSFGLGYDAPSGVTDSYFYFAYPFLLKVPGYDVRATNLPDAERDKNLEMLRWISDEAAARGLHFQLGLWTHAYKLTGSPNANHVIEGLTDDTQAPYSRDALAILLKECPSIDGVTFRIHGESGVPEGSYDLWGTIFDGVVRSGRKMPIDMHAKGMDQGTMDAAFKTGMPITISPKFWAEHMGLPYHQAAIRSTELPVRQRGGGAFASSNGARSFLRYGYGDLLAEDRKFGIVHRIWPGTQRVLLSGDPLFGASYSRAFSFLGSLGCEIMEPLSFKGRKGSGLAGHRTGYADPSLIPAGGDFEKYNYTYRIWGRLLYNPDAAADSWQRMLKKDYGAAAGAVEVSLANASRILPLFTTAHTGAAANNNYWPEMYVNMSIVDEKPTMPYGPTETPAPRRFGTGNPLDPQLFARVEDYVDSILKRESSSKYSPIEVANWLEGFANKADEQLAIAIRTGKATNAAFRRFAIDTTAQVGLGRFFAHKFRATVLYALYARSGDANAKQKALTEYQAARAAWQTIADVTKGAYVADMTYGPGNFQRGTWADRLAGIDQDIKTMESQNVAPQPAGANMIDKVMATPIRPKGDSATHHSPASFKRGQAVDLSISAGGVKSVTLVYRHTHQAESWQSAPMSAQGSTHTAQIPAAYTDTNQPLEYYFEFRDAAGNASMYPGFNATLSNQPYYTIRQA